jgi:hypothetical protein
MQSQTTADILRRLPRDQLEALHRKALLNEFRLRRSGQGRERLNPGQVWARKFANRASEFIGEVMGPAWFTDDWLAWRAFIKTAFAEAMSDSEVEVFRKCTGLTEPPAERQREIWLPVGRRGGKSRIEALVAVHLACCYDYSQYLSPGEMGVVTVLADTRDHAGVIMGYAKAVLFDHPKLKQMVRRPLVETVELEGNVEISIVTASIKAVRSQTTIAAVFDEIAFWEADESSANPDVDIVNAIRPSMITIPTAMQIGASSRYARKGVLWNAFRDYYGREGGPLVWSADTETMHPSIDRDFIAGEYEKDPVAAAAEYGLEWRSDVAAFVLREVVEAAVPEGVREREYQPGVRYRAFVDPSGGSVDSFTLAIAHRDAKDGRGVLDAVREVRPPLSPESVAAELAVLIKSYRLAEVTGDHYAGEWPREQFRKNGVEYITSDDAKSAIYQSWLPLLNSRRVELLDIPRLIQQACGLERRTSRVGSDTIDHAPGGHDDVVNAAAGALVLVTGTDQPYVVSDLALARMRARSR